MISYTASGKVEEVWYEWDERSFTKIEERAKTILALAMITRVQVYRAHYEVSADHGAISMLGGPVLEVTK